MTALNAYPTSRESIQPLFAAAQSRRNLAEAKAPELFVLLHGMLFTHIQLDDFHPTLARFLERLQLDGAQEREWIMMAVVNVGALLEYGKSDALLRPASGEAAGAASTSSAAAKKRELVAKMGDLAVSDTPAVSSPTAMEVDSATPTATAQNQNATTTNTTTKEHDHEDEEMQTELPYALQLSIQLAMQMFSFCLRHPTRRASVFAKPTLNPYITVLLTFLSTALKSPGAPALTLLERYVPWEDLAVFLSSVGGRRHAGSSTPRRRWPTGSRAGARPSPRTGVSAGWTGSADACTSAGSGSRSLASPARAMCSTPASAARSMPTRTV
jgi:protein SMG6